MTTHLPARLEKMLPPTDLARRLSAQSVLFAFGEGIFLTGSAVFFAALVGLSAAQVGLGLTVAGVVSFFFAVPSGKTADRIGPKRMWALGAAAEALLYLAWPWIGGFVAFLAMVILLEIVTTAGRSGRGAYTIDVFPRAERVRSQAFMRARPQHRLHAGCAGRRARARVRQQRGHPRRPGPHRADPRGQCAADLPPARRRPRPGARRRTDR